MLADFRREGRVLVNPAAKMFCGTEMCCIAGIPGMPGLGGICCPISGIGDCEFVYE